ncbi:hypothetical protein [Pelagovum pacificum]|uniref:Uncharacterized protein n=1 Tax=Pelagovum pacificum TaxID=2588711 RepID=A0A5C5GD72_9RHOB|nr:hypothetical protein [Pelagovum pacificum]QQA42397.1 hypothetical protein I8N54_16635 [Pelagovum pacificum]TNY31479.1 hypothetical protein FHY64_15825 [Pelagovum pacificum]
MIRALVPALFLAATPLAAQDEGLTGRAVSFGVLLYEDGKEDKPIFQGERHEAVVGDHVEYGLGDEPPQNGWGVIPAVIDISASRVEISYPDWSYSDTFPDVGFNGYVLDFLVDCVLFDSATIDKQASTGTLTDKDVFVRDARLYVDVGGQTYGPDETFVIELEVMDCPLS